MKRSSGIGLLTALCLVASTAVGFAGTVEEIHVSIGWQAGRADVVVIGDVGSRVLGEEETGVHRATIRVAERLKGPDSLPSALTIVWTGEEGPSVGDGRRALFFLLRLPSGSRPAGLEGELYGLVTGAYSTPAVGPDDADPVLRYVRDRLALFTRDADVKAWRSHLLKGVASASTLVVYSAALDFSVREGIGTGIERFEVEALGAAFRAQRRPDRVKRALAAALGATRHAAAVPPLTDWVAAGRARSCRMVVGAALSRIGDKECVKRLLVGLSSESEATRADVVNVLGRTGLSAAVEPVIRALADPGEEVRVEAALSTGMLARALRKTRRESPDVVGDLAKALGAAKEAREKKALLWASAQLDTEKGYDVVRRAAATATDREVRAFARRTLENPRRRPAFK
jgi:hypothetical protein